MRVIKTKELHTEALAVNLSIPQAAIIGTTLGVPVVGITKLGRFHAHRIILMVVGVAITAHQ